ncbi:MraY family glycosyltransferase [Arthrobacter russicus]|uniref:UDP-N-acetylmuramyl pentapeptide phosphotransferase/UDP-N-acetylglucosamine-1-phosphate transferase n=1 Tax=Arthrobacter russicus TaxID=172040 RepID=A0ABU1J7L5_9MICC|nr:glycosyltransferase family 4 protein [Arthrobacter russicus]MDR6268422.1 UDP-N-acetylmuramyl pentapeptide phosphotransferase/UDP-N-acetylglucosamine-1-phosphate transferase [Arthrobacter russicus]
MPWAFVSLCAATALLASLLLPLAFKPWLRRMAVLDMPSDRSSHSEPTIRGMGISVLSAVVLALFVALFAPLSATQKAILLTILVVLLAASLVGWIEDLRGLRVVTRALCHLAVGAAGTAVLAWLAGGIGYWWTPAGAVAVAAYINVANFMDGINGISGLHGLVVGLAYAIAGALTDIHWLVIAGAVIAAGFAGFLPWNLSGKPVFLGDVGSYLLGASIAITAVAAFLAGVPVEYLFAPVLIYLADAFVTLLRRIAAGERWYVAHRQHAYQRLVIVGLSHLQAAAVVTSATVLTSLLGIFAVANGPVGLLIAAVLCILVVLLYLRTPTIFQRLIRRRNSRVSGLAQ